MGCLWLNGDSAVVYLWLYYIRADGRLPELLDRHRNPVPRNGVAVLDRIRLDIVVASKAGALEPLRLAAVRRNFAAKHVPAPGFRAAIAHLPLEQIRRRHARAADEEPQVAPSRQALTRLLHRPQQIGQDVGLLDLAVDLNVVADIQRGRVLYEFLVVDDAFGQYSALGDGFHLRKERAENLPPQLRLLDLILCFAGKFGFGRRFSRLGLELGFAFDALVAAGCVPVVLERQSAKIGEHRHHQVRIVRESSRVILIVFAEEVVSESIDEQSADANAVLVFPGTQHLADLLEVAIGQIVQGIDGRDFRPWLGGLPSAAVVRIAVDVVVIGVTKRRQDLDAVVFEEDTDDLAVRLDQRRRITRLQALKQVCKMLR